jgi:outer membrane protein assembly factor BamA
MQVKRNPLILYSLFLWSCFFATPLFSFSQSLRVLDSFQIKYIIASEDNANNYHKLSLTSLFLNQKSAVEYVSALPEKLRKEGYVTIAIDSTNWTDSLALVYLFIGQKYQLGSIRWSSDLDEIANQILPEKTKRKNKIPLFALPELREKWLRHFEENGYPFATVWLDSVKIEDDLVHGIFMVDKGPFYTIERIEVHGDIKISADFFERYLNLPRGAAFDKRILKKTDQLLQQLSFLTPIQPSDISFLGNAGVLNIYVKPKKSNVINGILGFQPSTADKQKIQLTGDFLLDLKNALGKGENIWLKWQQLQIKSPRLQLGFVWPYVFKSHFGVDASFELFKKDSQFIQIQSRLGISQALGGNKTISLFLQWNSSNLLSGSIDSNRIKTERRLPQNQELRIAGLGFNATWNNTDYIYNPRMGNDFQTQLFVASRKIIKNNDILMIKSATFNGAQLYDSLQLNSFQFRIKSKWAHYFKTGKWTTFKLGIMGGAIGGKTLYRNELFQIGGFSTIRGFDEESKYASRYGIVTLEQRVLLGKNAYLSFFVDGAMVNSSMQNQEENYRMLGLGSGLTFETKAGILNLCLAFGNSNDRNFALREAFKIHFGFVNVF